MRRAIVLAFALLPGCFAAEPDPDADADPATVPTSLTYDDCDELLGAFPVQEDAVALPEGFAPAPLLGQGTGAVFIVGWSCAAGHDSTNATQSEPFVEAFAAFSVSVPEELRLEGAFAHSVLLGLATSSTVAEGVYESWGIPAVEGTVGFDWQATPIGGTGTLAGALGPLDVDMRVNAGGPNAPEAGSAVRTFVLEGETLVAAYDVTWIDSDGLQGQAISTAALPGAPPATTGLGFYYSSDATGRYVMTPFALPAAAAAS